MTKKNRFFLIFQCFLIFGFISQSCSKEQAPKPVDKIYDVVGITEKDARAFYFELRTAIGGNDKEKLSKMIRFPIGAKINGKRTIVNNKKEFIDNYKEIINKHIKDVVAKTTFEDLNPNWRGLFVGNGEIIFTGIVGKEGIFVTAINNHLK